MSGNSNVAHVSSVDKGLKMKIKRTKVPNKVDAKHEVVKAGLAAQNAASALSSSTSSSLSSTSSTSSASSSSSSSSSSASPQTSSTGSSIPSAAQSLTSANSVSASSSQGSSSSSSSSSSFVSSVSTMSSFVSNSMTSSNPSMTHLKPAGCGDVMASSLLGSVKSPSKISANLGAPVIDVKDGKSPKSKAAYGKKVKDVKSKGDPGALPNCSSICSVTGSSLASMDGRILTSSSPALTGAGQSFSTVMASSSLSGGSGASGILAPSMTSEPRPGDTVHMKKENPVHDPYEFNAKVEDKIELPPKKLKLDKVENMESATSPQPPHHLPSSTSSTSLPSSGSTHSAFQSPHHHHHHNHHHQQQQPHHQQQHQQQQQPPPSVTPQKQHVAVDACSVGMVTEPDCLGPCEPGTSVGLEGIVWKETDNGLLVVNVTWRGKTYVGTLMDATRYAWAPPRPSGCESPISDFESRTPKGRGKRTSRNSVQATEKLPEGRRLRKGRRGTAGNFTAPASPAKSDISSAKRKARVNDVDTTEKAKRSRSCSRCVPDSESPTTDGYIVCPEPNCHKKYKHMNGLRYHRTHAHRKSSVNDDVKEDEEEEEEEEEEEKSEKKEKVATVSERTERMNAKLRLREQRNSSRDSKDSLDDDIPLKEIATKANNQTKATTAAAPEEGKAKDKAEEADENIKYNNNTYAVSVNNKTDPQVVLHKTAIPHVKDTVSSGLQNAGKKSDGNNSELSSSTSSPSTFVPSLSSSSENNLSPLVNSNAPSNTNLPVMTSIKSPITSQIYQISPTGSLGGVSLISQGISTLSVVTTQTLPLMSSSIGQTPTSLSTSSSTSSSSPPSVVSSDKQRNKMGSIKGVMGARPVVSTLSSQMTGLNGPHIASMSSLSPGQSSSLKPLQPKPSQMVEYADVTQARKNKKKKDGDVAGPFTPGNTPSKAGAHGKDSNGAVINLAHEESPKIERSAVIKTTVTPSRTLDGNELPSMSHLEIPKSSNPPFPSSHESPNMSIVVTSEAGPLPGSRLAVPPNSLALGSTVHNSVDRSSPANDDVHSPAYSDISDANDSNSPPQQESPSKKDSSVKRDAASNGPQHLGPDGAPLPQHFGSMYYYQGAPNFLPTMSSPTLVKNTTNKKEGLEENRPSSSNEEGDKKDGGPRPLNPQEVDIQQKNLINYIQMHGFLAPDLQFRYSIPGYGQHPMDSYTAQMLQDPIHRQQLAEHQKRLMQQHQQELSGKSEEGSFKGHPFPGASQGRVFVDNNGKPVMSNSGAFNSSDGILDSKKMGDDLSQGLREKPPESNPFSKENIEVKSQGDGHPDFQQQSQMQANYQLMKHHQQHPSHNVLRAQMYPHQQQKPKLYDNRQDKRKMQPEINNSNLLPQGHGLQSLPGRRIDGMKPGELIPHDSIKKEIISSKDNMVRNDGKVSNLDNKRFEIKEEARCPSRPSSSSIDSNKGRPPSQSNLSNIPVGNLQGPLSSQSASSASALPMPSSSVSSASSSSSTPVPTSLAPSIPHTAISASGTGPFPYSTFYPPHFRPMHVDPTHPMYRSLNPHIIGLAVAPPGAYLHSPQLGYRLPSSVDGEVNKAGGIPDGVESLKMNADVGGPVHKIHELQEKGRPSPGVHSPAPPSKSAGDSGRPSSRTSSPGSNNAKENQSRDYANSPPTQRHVHTHHHTHVVGAFPPLYAPEAYSAMFSHPAAAAAATIPPSPHPFPSTPTPTPPAGPKT